MFFPYLHISFCCLSTDYFYIHTKCIPLGKPLSNQSIWQHTTSNYSLISSSISSLFSIHSNLSLYTELYILLLRLNCKLKELSLRISFRCQRLVLQRQKSVRSCILIWTLVENMFRSPYRRRIYLVKFNTFKCSQYNFSKSAVIFEGECRAH